MNKKKYCQGCKNNFYNNGGINGNTDQCWSLEDAEVVKKKKVPLDKKPPWNDCEIVKVPECYHDSNNVYVDPSVNR